MPFVIVIAFLIAALYMLGGLFLLKDAAVADKGCVGLEIAFEYSITPKLLVANEIYMESDNNFDKNAHGINPLAGLTYRLTECVMFDTAFKMDLRYGQKTEYAIISGASVSF